MTYNEVLEVSKTGDLFMLPNFIGYFRWSWATNSLIFINGEFRCEANELDILWRTDFYRII